MVRAVFLAPLAVLALAVPASASTSSPSPAPAPGSCRDGNSCDVAVSSPTPTPTPHSHQTCPRVFLESAPAVVKPGEAAGIVLTVDSPSSATTTVSLTRLLPSPTHVVREVTGTQRRVVFTVRVGESHRLQATASIPSDGSGSCQSGPTPAEVPDNYGQPVIDVAVRPTVSIAATRNAPRDYTFSGRVTPGRGQSVFLYRVESDGRRVLTSRTVVSRDGTYRVRRMFTGSGRFGFEAQVRQSSTNLAGASPVRPTVIH